MRISFRSFENGVNVSGTSDRHPLLCVPHVGLGPLLEEEEKGKEALEEGPLLATCQVAQVALSLTRLRDSSSHVAPIDVTPEDSSRL